MPIFTKTADFRKRLSGISRKLDRIFAKNVFFYLKTDFSEKYFANIFAMSAALSPWGKGFESRFLGNSEICRIIFAVYRENSVF
jgi:hypothetical protein